MNVQVRFVQDLARLQELRKDAAAGARPAIGTQGRRRWVSFCVPLLFCAP